MSESFPSYCRSRFAPLRRKTTPVHVGDVIVGGDAPIAVQSMTNTKTQDVEATVKQCIQLAEAHCDIVRVTAQNIKAAQALEGIRKGFSAAGFAHIPLVADIHFLPKAAMEALNHVEKVRINPGNFADQKKFKSHDYTDKEYDLEIERIHEVVSPFYKRCKELGRSVRIGTNHGSLSDRIMNRYGDSPMGMCESAMEFLRIARDNDFHDIVLSMKSSNTKVALQAYRLMVAMMEKEDFHLPLHLGVTEAGDGDDARIKSAIGISGLLNDGLGDTIRVSLTEDPVAEVPVGRQIAEKAEKLWAEADASLENKTQQVSYTFEKRAIEIASVGSCAIGDLNPPRVIIPIDCSLSETDKIKSTLSDLKEKHDSLDIEGIFLRNSSREAAKVSELVDAISDKIGFVLMDAKSYSANALPQHSKLAYYLDVKETDVAKPYLEALTETSPALFLNIDPKDVLPLADSLTSAPAGKVVLTTTSFVKGQTPVSAYRAVLETLKSLNLKLPLWVRHTKENAVSNLGYSDQLLEAAALIGAMICEGSGDFVSVETTSTPEQALVLGYNILQGARTRSSKTEYVACPSCGRTLFDLQTTTARIRERTGHLKGVTIAIMGCIVNGPGEMADADFGYVGGQPGKVNLYVGKKAVKFSIPSDDAVDELINLIKEHGMWTESKA
jgi:(E)-4-hydroxy-3-methylbut-2-enyl-diphosphate synthase